MQQHPDVTLAELGAAWQASGGRAVGQTCLWQVWPSSGCGAKKSLPATESDTPRVREARGQYVQAVVPRPDLARFHFLDETSLRLDQCRRYARVRGGQRVGQAVPRKRGRSLTLIGALSVGGLHGVQLLSAPLNQRSFGLYITRILAPQLRRGHVLVLDNLRVHHLTGLREWLGKRGVELLFLPPYSPDCSPIEQAWSKLKTKLRTAQARTEQALQAALHEAITWISSADARHWFAHCGYHVPPR